MSRAVRTLRLLAVLGIVGGLLAGPAVGKEGVRAKLDAPVHWQTTPGRTLRVAWHLVDGDGHRFGASGIFLRVSRCGAGPLRIRATRRDGGYVARVRMPKGGIRKLLVGLRGWKIVGEHRERADVLYGFDPPLRRRCP